MVALAQAFDQLFVASQAAQIMGGIDACRDGGILTKAQKRHDGGHAVSCKQSIADAGVTADADNVAGDLASILELQVLPQIPGHPPGKVFPQGSEILFPVFRAFVPRFEIRQIAILSAL